MFLKYFTFNLLTFLINILIIGNKLNGIVNAQECESDIANCDPYIINCDLVPGFKNLTDNQKCTYQNEKLPNPLDCRKYYLCYSNNDPQPEVRFCPQLSVFSPNERKCIPWCPCATITTTTNTPTETTTTTTETTQTTPTETTPTTTTETTQTTPTETTPTTTTETTTTTTMETTTTTTTEPTTTTTSTESTITTTTTGPTTQAPPKICTTVGDKYFNKNFCYKYYECEELNEKPTCYDCPKNTIFDPYKEDCIEGTCEIPNPPPEICTSYGRYQNYYNCHEYYNCNNLNIPPALFKCLPNKWFNPSTRSCETGECC